MKTPKPNSYIISKNIKKVIENRNMPYEKAAERVGLNGRQAFYYVLTHRKDANWSETELDYYCERLNLDKTVITGGEL